MSKFYKSRRVAMFHPPWRPRDQAPPPPTYALCKGYPFDCTSARRIAIVGENPGFDEDQASLLPYSNGLAVPFVGRSGEELDRFLDAYQIDPDDCFITNLGRHYKIGNADPTQEEIAQWEWLLHEELNVAKPLWIAAVGRISTRYFLGDVDMGAIHGIPFSVVLPWLDNGNGGRVTIIPIIHPAAGFHSTETQGAIAHDFAKLSQTLDGRLVPRRPETADQFPEPEYIDLTDQPVDLQVITWALSGGTPTEPLPVAIDTEGLPRKPWGLSFAVEAGKAYVIRKLSPLAIGVFYRALMAGIAEGRLKVILHNSLHDLRVLRELGIPLPDGSYTDTMVLAYHLCIEPQGLKDLAFRHCGMVMESYDEQVADAQDKIALEYYKLIESLVAEGTKYRVPEFQTHRLKVIPDDSVGDPFVAEYPTEAERDESIAAWRDSGFRTMKLKPQTHPPSEPYAVGVFPYIEPYTVLERDKATGLLRERTKKPQQIDRRVATAMKDLESGKIDLAGLRKRWMNTDDLVCDIVEEVIGEMREADLDDVPLARAVRYAARDADATWRVYRILLMHHKAMGLDGVSAIDHSIIPMVDRMQAVGIQVERDYFVWLSSDLKRRMLEVQDKIKAEFGIWINPNSGEQVADVLFTPIEQGGQFGLVPSKQTKGRVDKETGDIVGKRGSTVDKVIEGLKGEVERDSPVYKLLNYITDYRGLNKAKTSFCDVAIRKAVWEVHPVYDEDNCQVGEEAGWFIHCNFRITRVSSGRLSATGPNLMAVMGGSLGQEIREGYIAGPGYEFADWDLNQIEMRVMASEANDEFLISMIYSDEDIHAGTAGRMFKLNLPRPFNKKQVSKLQRDAAKRTGFGVITGIQAPGLVDQMRLQGTIVSEDEAAKWIVDWLDACPAVPRYMEACHREARTFGYVRDWTGRLRYLPGIHSPFRNVRAEAGRQSHSHKIQGGAQGIMKVGMARIWNEVLPYWWAKGKDVQPILQVHDELIFRRRGFTPAEKQEMDAQVRAAFFSAAPPGFRVPLDAGHGSADTWGSLEH